MFEERMIMDEIDKFFEDDEKNKKRYKLFLNLGISAEYAGKDIKLNNPILKKIKSKTIHIHQKRKNNDNLF